MLTMLRRNRGPQFLIVRRFELKTHFYTVVLKWIAEHFSEYAPMFRVRHLPYRLPRNSDYVLHIPWLQDPVQHWSELRYRQANQLAEECDRRGIPVVNRVDRLTNATKSVGSRLIAEAGIRAPRTVPITNIDEFRETYLGVGLPLFIRDDWRHGSDMIRADTREEVHRLPVGRFARPVAVELIDIPDRRDGLYRKYRYVAAGDIGVSHHLQMSREWITRGSNRERSETSREEELAYIAGLDRHHAELQRARAALGLDFVAFDYSHDHDGRIVIWEANPYPFIKFSTRTLVYRNEALHRTVAAMLAMYLDRGGLTVPDKLRERYSYGPF